MKRSAGGYARAFVGLTLGAAVAMALVIVALVVLFRNLPTSDDATDSTTVVPTAPPAAPPGAPLRLDEGTNPDDPEPSADVGLEPRFPDVLDVVIEPRDDGSFWVYTTMSSPYDSPARYADGWRVLAPDGTELGVRVLAHDHAGEQPFTRSLRDVAIPDDVTEVTVEGRDQLSGWGGQTVTVPVPR